MIETTSLPSELRTIAENQPYPPLFYSLGGHYCYGYPASEADYDLRGVHIAPIDPALGFTDDYQTLTLHYKEPYRIDWVTYDLKKFIILILEENGLVFESIYAKLITDHAETAAELKSLLKGILTRNHAQNYVSFSAKQWKMVEKFFPHSVKPFLTAFRLALTGLNMMQNGEIELNLSHLAEKYQLSYLDDVIHEIEIKGKGAYLDREDLVFYQSRYQSLIETLETSRYKSVLPTEPTGKPALNAFLIETRKKFDFKL